MFVCAKEHMKNVSDVKINLIHSPFASSIIHDDKEKKNREKRGSGKHKRDGAGK